MKLGAKDHARSHNMTSWLAERLAAARMWLCLVGWLGLTSTETTYGLHGPIETTAFIIIINTKQQLPF